MSRVYDIPIIASRTDLRKREPMLVLVTGWRFGLLRGIGQNVLIYVPRFYGHPPEFQQMLDNQQYVYKVDIFVTKRAAERLPYLITTSTSEAKPVKRASFLKRSAWQQQNQNPPSGDPRSLVRQQPTQENTTKA
ncbi:MAG: hypothetical protein M1504_04320 [Candidatus Marsarchaeota archaeon]|nr:hypothetical protein [Candidatus Marsarchaeota archaeon]